MATPAPPQCGQTAGVPRRPGLGPGMLLAGRCFLHPLAWVLIGVILVGAARGQWLQAVLTGGLLCAAVLLIFRMDDMSAALPGAAGAGTARPRCQGRARSGGGSR
ncbi:MAG: hypothetical protein K2X49_25475, partial [Acetobacteraceae bacterium]|nr:hypothetical protein [Acetobacteraceae bacterium]